MSQSFFMLGALQQIKNTPTFKLNELIDWEQFEPYLSTLHKRDLSHGGGQEPYSSLSESFAKRQKLFRGLFFWVF